MDFSALVLVLLMRSILACYPYLVLPRPTVNEKTNRVVVMSQPCDCKNKDN